MTGKTTKTVKKANSFIFLLLRLIIGPFIRFLYHFKFDMNSSKGIKRPCLILSNHQTTIDQFAVGLGFKFGINFIASDTLFRYGLKSKLMKIIGRPIPFSKGSSDLSAIRNMMSVIKQGGSVAMFPSGNRSFFGDECKIVDGIGRLAKKFNVPLVLVQLRGGYNVLPRWKKGRNNSKMTGCVTKVVSPEELSCMQDEEIDKLIQKELSFNEIENNKKENVIIKGKRKAEYLESVLFYCPHCNSLNSLKSDGNEFYCINCEAKAKINDLGLFEKVNKADNFPETILEWSKLQLDYIKNINYPPPPPHLPFNKPVFCDKNVKLIKAERAKKETLIGTGTIDLYNDKFTVCGREFLFTETTMAMQGVRKLTIYNNNDVYAVEGKYRVNLCKYMICGYHLRNIALNNKEEYYGY